jgi:hypothetical protein
LRELLFGLQAYAFRPWLGNNCCCRHCRTRSFHPLDKISSIETLSYILSEMGLLRKDDLTMAYKDLRDFIETLRLEGQLSEVSAEVDWRYEIGGIVRKNLDRKGPALLFKNIKEYHTPLFTCGASTYSRLALALGLPLHQSLEGIISYFRERIKSPIKARKITSGPCQENTLKGDKVDVLKFPVPLWQERDSVMLEPGTASSQRP